MMLICAIFAGAGPSLAYADPLPGYDLDPVELERRMDDCLAYAMPRDQILIGWVSFRSGAHRQWRCESLIHMVRDVDNRFGGNSHDPFVDVPNFMRCMDEVVSYGFPRPASEPRYTKLIKNLVAGSGQAYVVVNDDTGDIVTAYTTPRDNDWAGCARQVY